MKPDIVPAYDSLQEIGQLFAEYTDYLIEEDPSVKAYLQIQDYKKDEIPRCNDSPLDSSIYMRLDL